MDNNYNIVFEMGDNSDMEDYFCQKGFRSDVTVKIGNDFFEVYFFLASTLEYEMTLDGYCTYPGLIILEDITSEQIKIAVEKLYEDGFFNYLKPIAPNQKRYWHTVKFTPGG